MQLVFVTRSICLLVFAATSILAYPGHSGPAELHSRVIVTPEEIASAKWSFGGPHMAKAEKGTSGCLPITGYHKNYIGNWSHDLSLKLCLYTDQNCQTKLASYAGSFKNNKNGKGKAGTFNGSPQSYKIVVLGVECVQQN